MKHREDDLPKLIRDGIPEQAAANGDVLNVRPANDRQELLAFALKKLVEEAEEATAAPGVELAKALADVYEVLATVEEAAGLSEADIRSARDSKRRDYGGFDRQLILLSKDKA
jgi:predicted house-cleaning noncanonical NTP pyrophosphatase (MazG superfamily)